MKRIMISLVVFLLVVGFTTAASALSIDYTALTTGQTNVSSALGWNATATGGTFQTKSQAGWTGVGISGGYSGNEIDVAQSILFKFDSAQIISDFTLTLLFSQGPYRDPNEVAKILVNNTSWYYLTAKYPAPAATWVGTSISGATIENLSPANTTSGAAVWKVSNPFGDTAVTSLLFSAKDVVAGYGQDSDYCFNHLNTTPVPNPVPAPVPEPATLMLLGSGLLGLTGFRKKMKK